MKTKEIIDAMHQASIETFIILKPENITYLTGFKPVSPSVLILKDDAVLFTPKMELEAALKQSSIEVQELESLDKVKKLLRGTVGIEKSMPVSTFNRLCNNFKTKISDCIELSRQLKSDEEVKNIQKAIHIAEKAFNGLEITGSENGVAARIEYNMKLEGSKPAFDTIVASGMRSSIPHATISPMNIESPVVIDWGAVYHNYCSDITRTVVESEKQYEILKIVLEAQKKSVEVIKPGIKSSYVDKVARDVMAEYGYESNFIHSTGHGLGLEVHENPSLSNKNDSKLQKGMVITVEPGIYIKDEFGVRIEDIILIKNRGKILTNINREINF